MLSSRDGSIIDNTASVTVQYTVQCVPQPLYYTFIMKRGIAVAIIQGRPLVGSRLSSLGSGTEIISVNDSYARMDLPL
jgi:hypothetical protein